MATSSSIAPEAFGPTVTAGEILVEIMSTTIGNGFLEEQMFSGPYASGAPAIFVDQVARFGGSAGIISSVGKDDFGKLNINRLSADGVDVSAVATSVSRPTGSAFVRYRANGSRDFVFNIAHSAAGETAIDEAGETLLASAGHLHIMGSAFSIRTLGGDLVRAAYALKQRGGSVSLDPNLRKELLEDGTIAKHLDDVLAVTDLLLPSGEELLTIGGQAHEEDAVEVLLQRGVKEIVLKRGKEGATLFTVTDAPLHCPAFSVEEIDPTGAGDCFGAAYLTSRRMGFSADQSLQFANAAGAFAVTRLGPMEGVASRLELDQFIASQERGAA